MYEYRQEAVGPNEVAACLNHWTEKGWEYVQSMTVPVKSSPLATEVGIGVFLLMRRPKLAPVERENGVLEIAR